MVISWILNSVSKEISTSIIYAHSGREIWIDLRERFEQSNGPRIFQLRRELMNLSQDQQSLSVYLTKLKTIWEGLILYRPVCNCGKCTCKGVIGLHAYHQMEYTMSFLMWLHDSFSQIRGQLLLMDPMSPINKVFSLVSQEEHQRKVGIPTSETGNSIAFAVKTNIPKSNFGNSGTSKTNFAATNKGQNQNTNYKG